MSTHTPPAFFFFFNDTATTEIYTLSLHDALPIWLPGVLRRAGPAKRQRQDEPDRGPGRSEEHTSELQSPCNLVCRLLLEKKKMNKAISAYTTSKDSLGMLEGATDAQAGDVCCVCQ